MAQRFVEQGPQLVQRGVEPAGVALQPCAQQDQAGERRLRATGLQRVGPGRPQVAVLAVQLAPSGQQRGVVGSFPQLLVEALDPLIEAIVGLGVGRDEQVGQQEREAGSRAHGLAED